MVEPEARARPPLPLRHPRRGEGGHHRLDPALQRQQASSEPWISSADRVGDELPSSTATSRIAMCPAGGGNLIWLSRGRSAPSPPKSTCRAPSLCGLLRAPRASVRWPTCATCGSREWPVRRPRPTCRSPRRPDRSAGPTPTTRAGPSMRNTDSRPPSSGVVNPRLLSTETRIGTDKTLRQGRMAVTCNTTKLDVICWCDKSRG